MPGTTPPPAPRSDPDPLPPAPLARRLFHAVGRLRAGHLLRGFDRDSRQARAVNLATLRRILAANVACEFGRTHNFPRLLRAGGSEAYRASVPLTTWPEVAPFVDRMARGEPNVLTAEPVLFFALSSGTTGNAKRIPATASSFAHQRRYYTGINPAVPASRVPGGLDPTRGIILLSAAGAKNTTEGGTPLGMASANGISRVKGIVPYLWTSPWPVFEVGTTEATWYLHALFGLRERSAKFLNAVFAPHLLSWLRFVERHWEVLVHDVAHGTIDASISLPDAQRKAITSLIEPDPARAADLKRAVAGGFDGFVPRAWPWMRYIATVITGPFAAYVPALRRYLGPLPIHTTCYSASEAVLGLNLELEHPNRYVLASGSAYFEFIPEAAADKAQPETVELAELEPGCRYELVLSNYAGLYRYRLGDVMEVVDWYLEAPVLAFQHRAGSVLDLVGEKTSEPQLLSAVTATVAAAGGELVDYTVRGDTEAAPPRYVVYLEAALPAEVSPDDLSARLDAALQNANPSYAFYRKGGSLQAPDVRRLVPGAFSSLEAWREQHTVGANSNQIKTPRPLRDPELVRFLEARVMVARA